jgi:hypothetical protein
MKKALVSVFRLAMLTGILVLIPFIRKGPEAQLAHQCVTFDTDDIICPSCGCSNSSAEYPGDILTVSSTTGTQSIQDNTPWSCGTVVPNSCPATCSGTYPMAVTDSGCCIADGTACASNEPCCPGTTCSAGVCTATTGGGGGCIRIETCGEGEAWNDVDCACEPATPVILDTGGRGFDLTSASNGVLFDISGTGHPIQMGWTASDASNAFLTLPAADGLVHSGMQLFGNFTAQPPSATPNGFAALAVYDLPANGGNGDGIIDSRDGIYSHLRLWIDANHDGISQTGELHTLPSLGVESISLDYHLSQKIDQYGNVFRYRSRVNHDDPDSTHVGKLAYDVFLVTN